MQLSRLSRSSRSVKLTEAPLLSYNYIELQPVTEISSMVAMRHWLIRIQMPLEHFRKRVRAASFANNNLKGTKEILIRYVPLDEEACQVVLPNSLPFSE